MKITRKQIRKIVKESMLNEAGRGIMHIIKRNKGKRIKSPYRGMPVQYEFPDNRTAAKVVWEIHGETGREAANSDNIVTVYT